MTEADEAAYPPDPSFDRYARMVRATLHVPIALVTIVESSRQVFPGAEGLPAPWASLRSMPLSYSFCTLVVSDEAPLVVSDGRVEPRLEGNLSVTELGFIAYAGYPLTDGRGVVVGSLCAIDFETRVWTPPELALLEDLAAACSAELSERDQRSRAEAAVRATTAANHVTQVLLSLSEILAGTRTLTDVAAALHRIAVTGLDAFHAGIWVVDGGQAEFVANPGQAWIQASRNAVIALDDHHPVGSAVVARQATYYARRAEQAGTYPGLVELGHPDEGEARVFLPLVVAGEVLGCLVIVWPAVRDFDERDRLLISALTAYTAQAVHRAMLLSERATVASTLQNAMLTSLPSADGLELEARYRTAAHDERVGGDWYDVVICPSGGQALVIGDVVGHDTAASAVMGQLRSMMRAFVWQGDAGPAEVMQRLDRAARDLAVSSLATTVLAMLDPGDGARTLRWTNAGHPAPVVVDPEGRATSLDGDGYDCLLGVRPDWPRREHTAQIAPGSTILLFTDGLIESHERDLDTGRAHLVRALEKHHGLPLPAFVDAVLGELVGEHPEDDVALLAARLTVSGG